MSVTTTANRRDVTADGTAGPWTFSFPVYTTSDLAVYVTPVGGSATLKVLNVDYTQTAVNVPGGTTGGSITFIGASIPAANGKISLIRTLPFTQGTSFGNLDKFDAKTAVEGTFDKLEMQIQQLNEAVGRALTWPITVTTASGTLPDPTSGSNQGKFLYIAADGSAILAGTPISGGSIVLPLTVANGGTASTTALNNNRVMISSGGAIVEQSALTAKAFVYSDANGLPVTTAAPTDGQLLIGATGSVPIRATLTAGSGITITNAGGSITIAQTSPVTGSLTKGSLLDTGISFTANTLYTQAHGLGTIPDFVKTWLECVTGELGFNAGDRVEGSWITVDSAGSGGTSGFITRWDATNVYVCTQTFVSNPFVVNVTTPSGNVPITLSKWKIRAQAWKVN